MQNQKLPLGIKKRHMLTRIAAILTIGLIFMTSCDNRQQTGGIVTDKQTGRPLEDETAYNTSLQLMQGTWYHTQDSLATLTINGKLWTFNYKGEKTTPYDRYSISITDKLPEYAKNPENTEFLILTNQTDTLPYEILGITDSTLSLMYFPLGKIHLYRRQK